MTGDLIPANVLATHTIANVSETLAEKLGLPKQYRSIGIIGDRTGAGPQIFAADEAVKATNCEIVKIDVDQNPEAARKFRVMSIPTAMLFENGQVATQYVDEDGDPTMNGEWNINGSSYAIEGITSPDGRILGKMGHSERYEEGLFQNIDGNKEQNIFANGVNYFRQK